MRWWVVSHLSALMSSLTQYSVTSSTNNNYRLGPSQRFIILYSILPLSSLLEFHDPSSNHPLKSVVLTIIPAQISLVFHVTINI